WPGSIVSAALAPLAFGTRTRRHQTLFYALVVALFLALAINGPVLRLYLRLPLARTFRVPSRFVWVAGFGACMLTALGAETLVRVSSGWRLRLPLLAVLGAGALWLLAGNRPPVQEVWPVAGIALVAALASLPMAAGAHRFVGVGVVLVVA